jgi:hypothetical protein
MQPDYNPTPTLTTFKPHFVDAASRRSRLGSLGVQHDGNDMNCELSVPAQDMEYLQHWGTLSFFASL